MERGRGTGDCWHKSVTVNRPPESNGNLPRQVVRIGQRAPVEAPSARRRSVPRHRDEFATSRVLGKIRLRAPLRFDHLVVAPKTINDLQSIEGAKKQEDLIAHLAQRTAHDPHPFVDIHVRLGPELRVERQSNDGVETVSGQGMNIGR